jgi:hypothetical protein
MERLERLPGESIPRESHGEHSTVLVILASKGRQLQVFQAEKTGSTRWRVEKGLPHFQSCKLFCVATGNIGARIMRK